jgi:hypothetical protein
LIRFDIRTRRSSAKDSFKDSTEYVENRNNFRVAFDGLKDEYGNGVWCLDEAAVFKAAVVRQTYDFKGVNTACVKKKYLKGENNRDTIVACAGISGVKVPLFFIQHCGKNKTLNIEPVAGMNKNILAYYLVHVFVPFLRGRAIKHTLFKAKRQGPRMLESYIYDHADKSPLPQRHCLLWDQLSAHKSSLATEYLESVGIDPMLFPPKAASDLSMMDNSTFSAWRTVYRRMRANTRMGKFRCIIDLWRLLIVVIK